MLECMSSERCSIIHLIVISIVLTTTALAHTPEACSDRPSALCTGLQLLPSDPRDAIIPLGTRHDTLPFTFITL